MTTLSTFSNAIKYTIAGICFGFTFPIIAVTIDLLRLGLAFDLTNIYWVQTTHPIHLVIDTAPLFLGLFAGVGGLRQDKIEKINAQLEQEIREKVASFDLLEKTIAEKSRMEGELEIAKSIQLSMVPANRLTPRGQSPVDIYARLIPAREVGGDFYDYYYLDDSRLCFVVGDVSDKGVPAALMMAVCKTLIKSRASIDKSTASILSYVNNEIAKDNPNFMFVTVFLAILDTKTNKLSYSNAGHNPTYILNKTSPPQKLANLHGPVIGAIEGVQYGETTTTLKDTDFIFAYTDGVTEAQNKQEELFSDNRLGTLLEMNYDTPEALVEGVIKEVRFFEQGAIPYDDTTLLSIKLTKDSEQYQPFKNQILREEKTIAN